MLLAHEKLRFFYNAECMVNIYAGKTKYCFGLIGKLEQYDPSLGPRALIHIKFPILQFIVPKIFREDLTYLYCGKFEFWDKTQGGYIYKLDGKIMLWGLADQVSGNYIVFVGITSKYVQIQYIPTHDHMGTHMGTHIRSRKPTQMCTGNSPRVLRINGQMSVQKFFIMLNAKAACL